MTDADETALLNNLRTKNYHGDSFVMAWDT